MPAKAVTQCTKSEWRAIVQHARAAVPPPAGWTIRFYHSRAMNDNADCNVQQDKKLITIRVRVGFSHDYTKELVAHELAHALAWQHAPHVFASNHDEAWAQAYMALRVSLVGAKYARVYHAMFTDRD